MLAFSWPKITGLEVLARLRQEERCRDLPVIMLSASNRPEDVQRSYELGANSYIQKPVVFEKFLEALEVVYRYWFELARLPRSL